MTSSGSSPYPSNVDARNEMSLAMERLVAPVTVRPEPGRGTADRRLNISVIFTSTQTTLAALRQGGSLASSLGARITLLVPQIVPYPLPLESPPVLLDWNERRFAEIAGQSPVETNVRLYLCRDRIETLKNALSPHSLVVIGSRKTWWPFASEKRMASAMRRAGHEVILSEME